MYHARNTDSCHPSNVVADSVIVPAPYVSSPIPHHKRCGARRSIHRAITTPANANAMTVVMIGMKWTTLRMALLCRQNSTTSAVLRLRCGSGRKNDAFANSA